MSFRAENGNRICRIDPKRRQSWIGADGNGVSELTIMELYLRVLRLTEPAPQKITPRMKAELFPTSMPEVVERCTPGRKELCMIADHGIDRVEQ